MVDAADAAFQETEYWEIEMKDSDKKLIEDALATLKGEQRDKNDAHAASNGAYEESRQFIQRLSDALSQQEGVTIEEQPPAQWDQNARVLALTYSVWLRRSLLDQFDVSVQGTSELQKIRLANITCASRDDFHRMLTDRIVERISEQKLGY